MNQLCNTQTILRDLLQRANLTSLLILHLIHLSKLVLRYTIAELVIILRILTVFNDEILIKDLILVIFPSSELFNHFLRFTLFTVIVIVVVLDDDLR